MKTETYKLKYKITVFFLFFGILAFSQNPELATKSTKSLKPIKSVEKIHQVKDDDESYTGSEKEIRTSLSVDFRPLVDVVIYDVDTEILPARENKIEVYMNYIAEGKKTEDIQKLHRAIEENLIVKEGNKVRISTKFYNSYSSFIIGPGISKVNIELKDKSKIALTKFKITELKIYLPADMDLDLKAKYCSVDVRFSIAGKLKMFGYDAEIQAKSVSKNLDLEGKYSRFTFESVSGPSNFKLYESKLWVNKLTDLILDSKYSHLNIDQLNSIKAKGYEDDYDFTAVPDAEFEVKYTEIEIDIAKKIKASLYEGGMEVKEAATVNLNAKYADCDFGVVEKIDLVDGYENEVEVNQVSAFSSINGKYNEYHIENLKKSVKVNGYEDEIYVEAVGVDFENISVSGKYQDVDLVIPKKADYKFYGTIKYADLNIDEDDFRKKIHDKESSQLNFEYYHGKADNYTKEIKMDGYEVDVTINHQ